METLDRVTDLEQPLSDVMPLDEDPGYGSAPIVATDSDAADAFCPWSDQPWHWQLLPRGVVYRAYLGNDKASRFRSFWNYEKDHGWIWDITLGGRVSLFRYGTSGPSRPEGFEVEIEGAGIPRLDMQQNNDLMSADFRFGIPVVYGTKTFQVKVAYYHLSSHLGDEFLLKHPGYPRLNYSRDVLVNGYSWYVRPNLRLYAEAGWAFYSDVSEPWEFLYGIDYSPAGPTGFHGAPFAAVAGHLRQEVDYGGNLVIQAGWAWRGTAADGLLRIGGEYFNGKSDQFATFNESESRVGIGIWYDY